MFNISLHTYFTCICNIHIITTYRYAGDDRYSIAEKEAFERGIRDVGGDNTKKLKNIIRSDKQKTAENIAEKQESGFNLVYNPQRIAEVTKYLLNHPALQKIADDLKSMDPLELEEHYTEVTLRNFLISTLLMTGGGKRPEAITKLSVVEYQAAKPNKDGVYVVRIHKHKTFQKYGVALCSFSRLAFDGVYEALGNYMHAFR